MIAYREYLDRHRSRGAIFTMLADGSGTRQLTKPPRGTDDEWPDWSPDATQLAFVRTNYRTGSVVMTVRADGNGLRTVGPDCRTRAHTCAPNESWEHAEWSPDGKRLAIARSWGRPSDRLNQIQFFDLYLVRPDGTHLRRLTRISGHRPYGQDVRSPVWSPDGRRLVFDVSTSKIRRPSKRHALFMVNANGTGLRQLTPWALNAGDKADWSPDGRLIAFRTFLHDDGSAPGGNLYTIHPDGTGLRQLTNFGSNVWTGYPSFSPDGMSLVFGSTGIGGSADLYTIKLDGTGLTPITRTDTWESAAAWAGRP